MASMIDRMIRAAKFDVEFYNEAERDTNLTQEALLVVVLVSLVSGAGSFLGGLISPNVGFGGALLGAVVTVVLGVVNYYIWAYVTFYAGTKLFNGQADPGEMLRTLGYAQTPRLLGLLGFIPCVGPLFSFIGWILSLIAAVIAIREALDFDTTNAILTAIIGWVIITVITIVIGTVLGIGAIGVGAALGAFQGG